MPDHAKDFAEYQAIHRRWKQLIEAGVFVGHEVDELFARNEIIKNRHGGMPPSNPSET